MGSDGSVNTDPEAIRRIVERSLELEEENLHYERPPNILNNIEDIIREEVE